MALWWCITSNSRCSYEELKRRRCLALGWRDLGSLQRYIKDDPRWERQFKTRVQLKGNLAYAKDQQWVDHGASVPELFWRFINMPAGDYIVLLEAGSQLTLGKTEVFGIARTPDRAIGCYQYDDQFDHAHQIHADLEWVDWHRARFGELNLPRVSFKSLLQDDTELPKVEAAWAAHAALPKA
ncbi:hypothetical protein NFC81_02235 [Salinispirillum sp. LH 10-3-1]|uniref:Uncharacterized protein n=1 Tax=Salinispirillum sp. LH 10-3-1 TaxID=2952525 RepID=A0AB38YH17_9GAMM